MPSPDLFATDQILTRPWGEQNYSITGGGQPIIFIHGTGRSRHDWEPITPALRERRCVLPDLRGHGGSSVPRERFSLTDLSHDIIALADSLWLGRFDLVGHSLGGMIALQMLREFPERVDKVALLEGWTSLKHSQKLAQGLTERLGPEQAKHVGHDVRETFVRWRPGFREDFWTTVEAFNAADVLRDTSHAILEIYGDRGRPTPAPATLGIPERNNIQITWFKGRGHFMFLEDAKETARELRRFLIGDEPHEDSALPPATLLDLGLRGGR